MNQTTKRLSIASVLVLLTATSALAVPARTDLTPDAAPIRLQQRAPEDGTPQAAMLNLVLLREAGKTEEATALISSKCPDWLRESMLQSNGTIKKNTLSYQLREFTPTKALVSVDYNTNDGKFHGWTRAVILENGRWVVR